MCEEELAGTMQDKTVFFQGSDIPVSLVLVSIAFLFLTAMIVGLCSCLKGTDDNKTKKAKRRKKEGETTRKQTPSATDAEKGIPNGAINTVTGERPKSHDRALPEIPDEILGQNPYEIMPGEAQYDAIGKGSTEEPESDQLKIASDGQGNSQLESGPVQNLYELMPEDIDSDSMATCSAEGSQTYAKPNKKRDSSKTDLKPILGLSELCAEDTDDVVYAEPKKTKNPYESVKDIHQSSKLSSKLPANPQLQGHHDSLSVDTLDTSTSSAPPIPVKNFDSENEEVAQSVVSCETLRQTSIPGTSVADMSHIEVETAVVPLISATDVDLMHITPSQGFESSQTSTEGKREPPYSKVTARESLENLRRRQAAEGYRGSQTPTLVIACSSRQDNTDVDYDQINYDQIKSPVAAVEPSSGSTGDSELYAEIGGSVPSSARSSTYAAVNDLSLAAHAPTPPPVDILKQLTESGSAESAIWQHGRSVLTQGNRNSSKSSSGKEVVASNVGDGPLYAEVDKTKKTSKRQTVSDVSSDPPELLYSKVNKIGLNSHTRAKSEIHVEVAASGTALGYPLTGGTVLLSKSKMPENDYCVVDDDKVLSREDSRISSEYDPNYECVHNVGQSAVVNSRDSGVAVETGVAREIDSTTDTQTDSSLVRVNYDKQSSAIIWNKKTLIREPIYQEINDTKRNSKRKSKEAKEQKRSSRNSHRDSGNGGSSKPL